MYTNYGAVGSLTKILNVLLPIATLVAMGSVWSITTNGYEVSIDETTQFLTDAFNASSI